MLFNRFYQPDIDLTRLALDPHLALSHPCEMRLPLVWVGVLHGHTKASLAAWGLDSPDAIRGRMSHRNIADPTAFERANYVKTLNAYKALYGSLR